MDQELKQRLIGALVITALAAIFIPMLFDDPVDESGRMVNELTLPEAPVDSFEQTADRLSPEGSVGIGQNNGTDESENIKTVEVAPSAEPEPFVEEPIYETAFESEPFVEEPIYETAFEPEPFVEEPIHETVLESEPIVSPPALNSKTADAKPAAKSKLAAQKSLPAATLPDSSSSTDGWYIQLGSFSQKENAFSLRDKLRIQGFPATVDEATIGRSKSYRLVVGPEHDKDRAQAMQARLDKQQHTKSLLVAVGQAGEKKTGKPSVKKQATVSPRPFSSPKTNTPQSSSTLVRWYIQLGSFSQRKNAYLLRDKLRSQGFSASIDEAITSKGKSYRLRVGPEIDKKRAETMQANLKKQNHLNSLLVSE